MEIILKQDVNKLGYKDEIVKVKDGYANNYLIPQGYAVVEHLQIRRYWQRTLNKELSKKKNSEKMLRNTQLLWLRWKA